MGRATQWPQIGFSPEGNSATLRARSKQAANAARSALVLCDYRNTKPGHSVAMAAEPSGRSAGEPPARAWTGYLPVVHDPARLGPRRRLNAIAPLLSSRPLGRAIPLPGADAATHSSYSWYDLELLSKGRHASEAVETSTRARKSCLGAPRNARALCFTTRAPCHGEEPARGLPAQLARGVVSPPQPAGPSPTGVEG